MDLASHGHEVVLCNDFFASQHFMAMPLHGKEKYRCLLMAQDKYAQNTISDRIQAEFATGEKAIRLNCASFKEGQPEPKIKASVLLDGGEEFTVCNCHDVAVCKQSQRGTGVTQ